MSKRKADTQNEFRPPNETSTFHGHSEAEAMLLDSYRSGHCPHAWLIGGPKGVGKATLAYRMARFVLANPDPASGRVNAARSLEVEPSDPAAKHIAAGTHGGLLVLERTLNDKGVLRQEISVDTVRETVPFFGSTSSGGGWRICIVDTVDDLNASSANALLKVLEEPPQRSLFLLVSNAPARVLPTIQSRCRKLRLRALETDDVTMATADALDSSPDAAMRAAAEASEGSVSRALTLLGGESIGLQQRTEAMLDLLPKLDPVGLHGLGDSLAGNDKAKMFAFTDTIDRWMSAQLQKGDANANLARLARLSEVWDKINAASRETLEYNLERKPLVFSVFGMLAKAAA